MITLNHVTRLVITLVLVAMKVAVSTSVTDSSHAASGKRPIQLAGRTSFSASTISRTLVRFPQDVDITREFHARIKGNGRIKGFVIRKVGSFGEHERPLVHSIRLGRCRTRACRGADTPSILTSENVDKELSGTWELFLIADSSRVTVTFEIERFVGVRRVGLEERVASEIRSLRTQVHEEQSNLVFAAGDFTRLRRPQFGFVGLWLEGKPHASSAFGACFHRQEPKQTSGKLAFLPGCPTGESQWDTSTTASARGWKIYFASSSSCCPKGLGGWYTTLSDVTSYGATALWLDY